MLIGMHRGMDRCSAERMLIACKMNRSESKLRSVRSNNPSPQKHTVTSCVSVVSMRKQTIQ